MNGDLIQRDLAPKVIFVCLHGSAKSLIAAEYVNRFAKSRGLAVRAESMGLEPDAEVLRAVVAGLARDGIDVAGYVPRRIDLERFIDAPHVVSLGCDVRSMGRAPQTIEEWNDLPMVSDGYSAARDAIVARVETLLEPYGREAP